MKKLIPLSGFFCLVWLAASLWSWLQQPNNFLYTIETRAVWNFENTGKQKAKGYSLKLDPVCAGKVYTAVRFPANEDHDLKRFAANRSREIEFNPEEISSPSRFKWLREDYITYDDPGLKSGIRHSFRNKCLYDRECGLEDSMEYLFVKTGVRYFLNSKQFDELKSCVSSREIFYHVNEVYNFGRSDRHHRNGVLQWLDDRLTKAKLAFLFFLVIL